MTVAHTHRIRNRLAADHDTGPIHTHPVVDGIPHSVYIDSDDTWHTHRVSETSPDRTGPAIAIHRIQDQADAR